MTPYNLIFQLHADGLNNTQIAARAKCARGTVITTLKLAEGLDFTLNPDNSMTDLEIHRVLHPPVKRTVSYKMPDMGEILFRITMPKESITKIWTEYCDETVSNNLIPYSKSAFQGFVRDIRTKYDIPSYDDSVKVRLVKDICDDMPLLLYAELGTSNYVIVIPVEQFKPRMWINANNKLLEKLGGIPENYIFVGHLPKAFRDETSRFVNFNGMMMTEIKDKRFGTRYIEELKKCLNEGRRTVLKEASILCENFNSLPLFSFSNFDHFDAFRIQRRYLRKPSERQYETIEFLHPVPQINFHVFVDGKYYSVPFELRHEHFTARVSNDYIELMIDGAIVYCHDRIKSDKCKYRTIKEHMPASDEEIPWNEMSGTRLKSWAREYGPAVYRIIRSLLSKAEYEPQAYKACLTILRLGCKYGNDILHKVCEPYVKDVNRSVSINTIKQQCIDLSEKESKC